jgi:hypothetical protein
MRRGFAARRSFAFTSSLRSPATAALREREPGYDPSVRIGELAPFERQSTVLGFARRYIRLALAGLRGSQHVLMAPEFQHAFFNNPDEEYGAL